MEILLIVCLFGLVVGGWIHFRNRLYLLESQVDALTRAAACSNLAETPEPVFQPVPPPPQPVEPAPMVHAAAPAASETPAHPAPPAAVEAPTLPPEPEPQAPPVPSVSPDWEATLGGNWLSKAGVLLFVISIALGLGYSFNHMGPAGRVAISLTVSFAMLAAGALFEPRERYAILARGLLGGGWAALYFTVYAMHAVPAARVIENPALAAALLFAAAAGMIVHSLRYRSQTVSGLAYFIAFTTLAITQITALSMVALVPLAASLLYLARRFAWSEMAIGGLIATYSVLLLRGDTGAPLWQAQAIFSICWLLFEAYDIVCADSWLLPLNAAGFLGLSLAKWHATAPDRVWLLLSASALAYLASARLRRSARWQPAVTLASALAAASIFQRLDHQWVASTLMVEAELCYLAGVRLRLPYLRWLAVPLFGLEAVRLLAVDIALLPVHTWAPIAGLNAAVLYANRALYAGDVAYGYAAAALAALIAGYETTGPSRGQTWFLLAAAPFLIGWWRRLRDFRIQGYALALLGILGLLFAVPQPPLGLAIGTALSYAAALAAAFSGPERWGGKDWPAERDAVRRYGAFAASIGAAALVWRLAPAQHLGLEWMALGALLLELGLRSMPRDLCVPAYAAAALGAIRILNFNMPLLRSEGPLPPRLVPAAAAVLAYWIAARSVRANKVFAIASAAGTALLLTALWALAPNAATPAWALTMLALLYAGSRWSRAALTHQSYAVAALAFGRCLAVNIIGDRDAILAGVIVIAFLYAAQFLSSSGSPARLYYSLLATGLATLLLYYKAPPSLLTVAWGIEGVALLASGFPLRDRLLRLSGLALLLVCILKLFVWDLRHLDTLPRIFSFMALGLLLVGVSWIYSRFRERLASVLRL